MCSSYSALEIFLPRKELYYKIVMCTDTEVELLRSRSGTQPGKKIV
jgi:hypothetical protein